MSSITRAGILAAFLLAGTTKPGLAAPPPGSPAPPLEVERLLQAPDDAGLAWDSAAATVVEFWGTWCKPCVESIPEVNALEERFAPRGVRFVWITDEDADLVQGFLARRPVSGWVALDTDRSTFDAYGAEALPRTVLVGRDGRIAATFGGHGLSAEILEALLDGRPLTVDAPPAPFLADDEAKGVPTLFRSVIREGDATAAPRIEHTPQWMRARSIGVGQALSLAYDVGEARTVRPFVLPEHFYDFEIATGGEEAFAWRGALQDSIRHTFGIGGRIESQRTEVLVLAAPDGAADALAASESHRGTSARTGRVEVRGETLRTFAAALETALRRPVLDETGIDGTFDLLLTWDTDDPAALAPAVREQLGLRLEPARREIPLLVLERR